MVCSSVCRKSRQIKCFYFYARSLSENNLDEIKTTAVHENFDIIGITRAVNKAGTRKAKARTPKAKAKTLEFCSKPDQGQGRTLVRPGQGQGQGQGLTSLQIGKKDEFRHFFSRKKALPKIILKLLLEVNYF